MTLGEWWVANPGGGGGIYEPLERTERVPGALLEASDGEIVLETIGFLGSRPFTPDELRGESDPRRAEIWGTDRDAMCYSLFDTLRRWTWSAGHVSEGYEDWRVGWLAKGNAWVTPDEECISADIVIDGLDQWALYQRPDNIGFDEAMDTVTIDLRKETLGTAMLGNVSVSLVRSSGFTYGGSGASPERHFSFANVVCWKVEGSVTLRAVVEEWAERLGSLSRFMTMRSSVVSSINCRLPDSDSRRLMVELVAPPLERPHDAAKLDNDQHLPFKYLTTLHAIKELGIDPMVVLAGYWRQVANGDAYMAMALHLESQDRLLVRGNDGALLNAIRSVESLYAVHNSNTRVKETSVQSKIDDALSCAGDVGSQLADAWPSIHALGVLRRDLAHGRARPSASFDLQCLGGATALQWIQRLRLLAEMGIGDAETQEIISGNFQYGWALKRLREWSTVVGS